MRACDHKFEWLFLHLNNNVLFLIALPYLVLPYRTLLYFTLPYLTLPYRTLPYLILLYLTLTLTLRYHHTQPPNCVPHFYLFFHHQSTVSRKRESMKLFENSKSLYGGDKDSDTEKLLGERTTIAASMRSINSVIRYIPLRMTSMSCTVPYRTFFSFTLPYLHLSYPTLSNPILLHQSSPFSFLPMLIHLPYPSHSILINPPHPSHSILIHPSQPSICGEGSCAGSA